MGLSFRIRGGYFESCNCEAICPCRMIGGLLGGRSTYGICFGVLSWCIEEGRIGDVDVSGLATALVYRYDDDEPSSPWSLVLHVDARADEPRHAALRGLFLGELGGPHISQLPWISKARHVIEVRTSAIDVTSEADGYSLRVGAAASVRATRPVETDQSVACIVPGYDRAGRELYADDHVVHDDPFAWELTGKCAYAADFDYASAAS